MDETLPQLFQQMETLVRSAPPQEVLLEEMKILQWKILCLWHIESSPHAFPFTPSLYQLVPRVLDDLNETVTL